MPPPPPPLPREESTRFLVLYPIPSCVVATGVCAVSTHTSTSVWIHPRKKLVGPPMLPQPPLHATVAPSSSHDKGTAKEAATSTSGVVGARPPCVWCGGVGGAPWSFSPRVGGVCRSPPPPPLSLSSHTPSARRYLQIGTAGSITSPTVSPRKLESTNPPSPSPFPPHLPHDRPLYPAR